jgi:hypothetical protein
MGAPCACGVSGSIRGTRPAPPGGFLRGATLTPHMPVIRPPRAVRRAGSRTARWRAKIKISSPWYVWYAETENTSETPGARCTASQGTAEAQSVLASPPGGGGLIFNRAPALLRRAFCVVRVPRPQSRRPEEVGTHKHTPLQVFKDPPHQSSGSRKKNDVEKKTSRAKNKEPILFWLWRF